MKRIVTVLALLVSVLIYTPNLLAGELKSVTLDVDKMTCDMCPITVKKALKKVDGVEKVVAKYEGDGKGWVTITYDPSKSDIDDFTFATEEAGYSSRVQN